MTKRAVWIVCFVIALASVGSVAYRMSLVTHFDSATWRAADEPAEFLERRAMMTEVERMFATAHVRATWQLPPGADQIAAKDRDQLGGEIKTLVAETVTDDDMTQFVRALAEVLR